MRMEQQKEKKRAADIKKGVRSFDSFFDIAGNEAEDDMMEEFDSMQDGIPEILDLMQNPGSESLLKIEPVDAREEYLRDVMAQRKIDAQDSPTHYTPQSTGATDMDFGPELDFDDMLILV